MSCDEKPGGADDDNPGCAEILMGCGCLLVLAPTVVVGRQTVHTWLRRYAAEGLPGLAECLTPEPAIGGRAWPNFRVEGDPRREEALALWANTTPGLISFWWIAGRQQQGRAILTISQLPCLTALDVRALDYGQLEQVERLFAEFAERDFLPANEAYRDETRQALDRAVLCGLIGLPESILEPLAALRLQWCEEPSVHGGKPTRPGGGG